MMSKQYNFANTHTIRGYAKRTKIHWNLKCECTLKCTMPIQHRNIMKS